MELTQQACRPLLCSPSFLSQPENTAFAAHACVRECVCVCLTEWMKLHARSVPPSVARTSLSSHLSQPDHSSPTRRSTAGIHNSTFALFLSPRPAPVTWLLLSASPLFLWPPLRGSGAVITVPPGEGNLWGRQRGMNMHLGLGYPSRYCTEGEQTETQVWTLGDFPMKACDKRPPGNYLGVCWKVSCQEKIHSKRICYSHVTVRQLESLISSYLAKRQTHN